MSDRYRDLPGKCDRYLPPPHYLAGNSAIVSSGSLIGGSSTDSYIGGYLSSTVHTPVKRYVPSTHADIYSDASNHTHSSQQSQNQQQLPQNSSTFHHLLPVDGNGTIMASAHHPQPQQPSSRSSSQNSSFSYRHHMKCCANIDAQINCGHHSIGTGTMPVENLYGTTPRMRQINTKLTMASQTQTNGCSSNGSSARSSIRNLQNEHNFNEAHAIDYACGNPAYMNCKAQRDLYRSDANPVFIHFQPRRAATIRSTYNRSRRPRPLFRRIR